MSVHDTSDPGLDLVGRVQPRPWLECAPFSVNHREFADVAAEIPAGEGACCVFAVDTSVPWEGRGAFANLVIAWARAGEPVTVFDDGSAALLIRDGGAWAGRKAAERILHQAERLQVSGRIRVGIQALSGDVDQCVTTSRQAADATEPGHIGVAA